MASVTIKNMERLLSRLQNISEMDLTQTMNKATALVHGQAKLLAPVDKGSLGASIHMKVNKVGMIIQGKVYTNLQYAPYVEFGTGIKGNGTYKHKLKDINLTYRDTPWVYTPDGGETFYRTEGQVAQPYMYPALSRNKKTIRNMFKVGIKDDLKSKCKGGK